MPLHIFLGDEVLLYFIVRNRSRWNSNLIWIQNSLQFIKKIKKEKWFSIFPSLMGWNLLAAQLAFSHARPDQPS
jgi:hypothetical protein